MKEQLATKDMLIKKLEQQESSTEKSEEIQSLKRRLAKALKMVKEKQQASNKLELQLLNPEGGSGGKEMGGRGNRKKK